MNGSIGKNILKIENGIFDNIYGILLNNHISGKFLLLTDEKIFQIYGKKLKEQLEKIDKVELIIIEDNSLDSTLQLVEKIIENDYQNIVGLGGGRVLDVSKYASYTAKKTFISIPTTIANDGIASPIAVLKMHNGKVKSLGCKMADIILLDTGIISSGPKDLIKAGIGDTISNYMALIDWKLAERRGKENINDMAYLMSRESLNTLMKTQYDSICPGFIEVLANSIVLSGIAMNFAGTSRPVSGSEHLFSHALDFYGSTQNLHGFQVALGTVTMLKIINYDYSEVISYLKKFEININPINLNINEDEFVNCIIKAPKMRTNRYTYLNEMNLSEDNLRKIYKELVEEL